MSPARSANDRARDLGFPSASQLRRFGGVHQLSRIKGPRDLMRLPPVAQDVRHNALKDLSELRRGKTIEHAALDAGTTIAAMHAYVGPGLERRRGRTVARPADRLYRRMTTYFGGKVVEIDVRGSRVATLVSRHRLAVEAFVSYESFEGRSDADILHPFVGKRVGGVTLETDPRVLMGMARRGLLEGGPYADVAA